MRRYRFEQCFSPNRGVLTNGKMGLLIEADSPREAAVKGMEACIERGTRPELSDPLSECLVRSHEGGGESHFFLVTAIQHEIDYNRRELARTNRELAAYSHEPANIRAERKAEFSLALCRRPEAVAERIRWIKNGDYGRGAQIVAERLKAKGLGLYPLIGQLEWMCSARDAHQAWMDSE